MRTNGKHLKWTLDGKVVGGDSPRLELADVPAGSHTLRAEAKGFEARQESIAIAPRELASLEWNLTPQKHAAKRPGKAIDDGAGDSSWPPK